MRRYGLHLESGPKHRKTMVHMLDLLGCISNGPTTEDAIAAVPEAITAYRRLLVRAGEDVDPDEPFETAVVEHITEGTWMGNGSPYFVFARDLEPVDARETELLLRRFHQMREELAAWVETQTDELLDAKPANGRTGRAIIQHIAAVPGAYLSPVAGGAPGFSRVGTLIERRELSLHEGPRRVDEMIHFLVRGMTSEQRSAVIQRPKDVRTFRKAMRSVLEHDWEHLAELSRRPGGPVL